MASLKKGIKAIVQPKQNRVKKKFVKEMRKKQN